MFRNDPNSDLKLAIYRSSNDFVYINTQEPLKGHVLKKSNYDNSYSIEQMLYNTENSNVIVENLIVSNLIKNDQKDTTFYFVIQRTQTPATRRRLLEAIEGRNLAAVELDAFRVSLKMQGTGVFADGAPGWFIAVVVIGALLIIGAIILTIVCCVKKSKKNKKEKERKKNIIERVSPDPGRQRAKSKETISLRKITLNKSPENRQTIQFQQNQNPPSNQQDPRMTQYSEHSGQPVMGHIQPNIVYNQQYGQIPMNPQMRPSHAAYQPYNPYQMGQPMGQYGGQVPAYPLGPEGIQLDQQPGNNFSMNPSGLPPDLAPPAPNNKESELEMYEINVGKIDQYEQKK